MKNITGTDGLTVETKKKPARVDAHYVSHEIQHLLHFEKGFLFTVRELLLRPGKSVREFMFEDRSKYMKPVVFLIFTSVIFTLIVHYFHIEYSLFNIDKIKPLEGKIRSKEIGEWIDNHVGYMNLMIGVFIALWTKLFFRKYEYNIFEITILLCFVLGEAILFLGLFLSIAVILKGQIIASIGVAFYLAYPIWAVGQFFGERTVINYVKSALMYATGIISYMATLILIAYFLKLVTG